MYVKCTLKLTIIFYWLTLNNVLFLMEKVNSVITEAKIVHRPTYILFNATQSTASHPMTWTIYISATPCKYNLLCFLHRISLFYTDAAIDCFFLQFQSIFIFTSIFIYYFNIYSYQVKWRRLLCFHYKLLSIFVIVTFQNLWTNKPSGQLFDSIAFRHWMLKR